jgi:hypothetical protein
MRLYGHRVERESFGGNRLGRDPFGDAPEKGRRKSEDNQVTDRTITYWFMVRRRSSCLSLGSDNAELTQRQGQAYSQRSESPRFGEESLHLGMRAAVDQVL